MSISIDFFNYPQITELDRRWSVENGKVSGVALINLREGQETREVTVTCGFEVFDMDDQELERKVNSLLDQKIKDIRFTRSKEYTDISTIDLEKLPPAQRTAIEKIQAFKAIDRPKKEIPPVNLKKELKEDKTLQEWKSDKRVVQLEKDREEHTLTGVIEGTLSRFKNLAKTGRFKTDVDIAEKYIHEQEEKIEKCGSIILDLIKEYEKQHANLRYPLQIYLDFSVLDVQSEEEQNLLLDYLDETLPRDRYVFIPNKEKGSLDLLAAIKGGK